MNKFKDALAIPGAIVGAIVALWLMFTFLGDIITAPKKLKEHMQSEQRVHIIVDSVVREIDDHSEDASQLLNSLIRGECIENPVQDLQRQGLIKKCTDLGIIRAP